jgi:hypothetical protein
MVQRIAHGPLRSPIVVAGRNHLPELHKALHGNAHVIPIATLSDEMCRSDQDESSIRRNSYVMAHPDVMRVRGSDALEDEPFGFAGFASQLGIHMATQRRSIRP